MTPRRPRQPHTQPSLPLNGPTPIKLDRAAVCRNLDAFEFGELFREVLGWDHAEGSVSLEIKDTTHTLQRISQKAGFFILAYDLDSNVGHGATPRQFVPPADFRRAIDTKLRRVHFEHIVIYHSRKRGIQTWQFTRRLPNGPIRFRDVQYIPGQQSLSLLERLERLYFDFDFDPTILDVSRRANETATAERVTKRFFDQFRIEHSNFRLRITGLSQNDPRTLNWYTSIMLNRLMFVYFIQKKGFLDGGNKDYLQDRLTRVRQLAGPGQFHSFYRTFLLALFHRGFAAGDQDPALLRLIGTVPYLNGGLFEEHAIERENPDIAIPDEAFANLFAFFDGWTWHLDERPNRNEREINPDILGYIFEKYINYNDKGQRENGAYYTKEDITEYIGRSTLIPRILAKIQEQCAVAFEGPQSVWRYLAEDPDRYIFSAVSHGITTDWYSKQPRTEPYPYPPEIAAGFDHIPSRQPWNKKAPLEAALPEEIWREVIARRTRYQEVHDLLASGSIQSSEPLITHNLDLRQFAQDIIERAEGPDLVLAAYRALASLTVLDPTCGSGAFLFAALNILQPLYEAALDRMAQLCQEYQAAHPDRDFPPRSGPYRAIHSILQEVDAHPNRAYAILKSIVLHNLYGVDIMAEAVEICKLRLFLKLTAQLDSVEQIEPLPDLDFNVLPGNTLIGFENAQAAREAITGDYGTQADWPGIAASAADFENVYEDFQRAQSRRQTVAEDVARWKRILRETLGDLREQLDRALARQLGQTDENQFLPWRTTTQPFHWFVEFYRTMRTGGFDCIVGNPPYVESSKVPYALPNAPGMARPFADIYAHVAVKALTLKKSTGRLGLIVPINLMFSADYTGLRDRLINQSLVWASTFDKIPAAIFHGVKQRCTIALCGPGVEANTSAQCALRSTGLLRWVAKQRPCLMDGVAYTQADGWTQRDYWPKFPSGFPAIARLLGVGNGRRVQRPVVEGQAVLGYSKTAANFMSFFLQAPPSVVSATSPVQTSNKIGWVQLQSSSVACACLAVGVSDTALAVWLVIGDGFDTTRGNVVQIIRSLEFVDQSGFDLLVALGEQIHNQRFEALAFKLNAGVYIGNFNYRRLHRWTRRVDLVLLAGLGATKQNVLTLFDYVQRLLAINEQAGERGIPAGIKNRFPPAPRDPAAESALLEECDAYIRKTLGFSQEEIDYLCERDPVIAVQGAAGVE